MNPNHIYKVSQSLDAQEREKERVRRQQGYEENHPRAKLTDQGIVEIRLRVSCGGLRKDVATEFGISKSYGLMLMKKKSRVRYLFEIEHVKKVLF